MHLPPGRTSLSSASELLRGRAPRPADSDAPGLRLRRSALQGLVLALAAFVSTGYAAAPPNAARTPILIELFTSEGCSSCPPVDAWLGQLDKAQPVPGAQLIVLSEHVDYWDHDGWKDPWSSALLTARQRDYGRALGLNDVYTPQVILDGDVEVHPWQREQVEQSFEKVAQTPSIPVRLDSLAFLSATGVLNGRIAADGSSEKHSGDVFVAVALDHAESSVQSGENSGRHLAHVAVVRELRKVGKLEKGKSFEQPFQIRLWPGADRANLRVIAFVQESGPGRIIGSAVTKTISPATE